MVRRALFFAMTSANLVRRLLSRHVQRVFLTVFYIALATATFLAPAKSAADEMTFDVIYMNHTNIIVADGVITESTPDRFQEFLDAGLLDGFIFIVHLNSDGGNLFGGLELGRMIREQRFATGVRAYPPRGPSDEFWDPPGTPGSCMSACALAFLGGEQRRIEDGSIIGFHQFSRASASLETYEESAVTQASTQVISSVVLGYVFSMGADVELFRLMSLAMPDEMFIPSPDEQVALGIVSRSAFSNFGFEPFRDGVIAYSVFRENVQGRQIIEQLTTFCRSGVPYILLSGPEDFSGLSQDWITQALPEMRGFEIWSNRTGVSAAYPPSNVSFRAGSRALVEVRLDQRGVSLLQEGAQGSISLPGVFGYFFGFTTEPSIADREKIRSSFRHCIS